MLWELLYGKNNVEGVTCMKWFNSILFFLVGIFLFAGAKAGEGPTDSGGQTSAVAEAQQALDAAQAAQKAANDQLQEEQEEELAAQNKLKQDQVTVLQNPSDTAAAHALAQDQQAVAAATQEIDQTQVVVTDAQQKESAAQDAAIKAEAASGNPSLPGTGGENIPTTPSTQTPEQIVMSDLETIQTYIKNITTSPEYEMVIQQAETLIQVVEADEATITNPRILQATAEVKAQLQTVIEQKAKELYAQQYPVEVAAQAAAELQQQVQAERTAQIQKQAQNYLANASISAITDSFPKLTSGEIPTAQSMATLVSGNFSGLDLNLRTLALRESSLEDMLASVADGSPEQAALLQVQVYEQAGRQALVENALPISDIQDNVTPLLSSTSSDSFVHFAQSSISFLQSPEVMNVLDPVSQAYVAQLSGQFNQALSQVTTALGVATADVSSSFGTTLGQFQSGSDVMASVYDAQTQLYYQMDQLQKSYKDLGIVLSGCDLSSTTIKTAVYIQYLQSFGVDVAANATGEVIAQNLRTILTPQYALDYIEHAAPGSQEAAIAQNLLERVGGSNVLKLPVDRGSYSEGIVLCDADAQRIKINFYNSEFAKATFKSSQVPTDWHYVSSDFLKELGNKWLESSDAVVSAAPVGQDSLDLFNIRKMLCDSWYLAGDGSTKVIDIFRQMGTEMYSSPLTEQNTFRFLTTGEASSPLSNQQIVNAIRVREGMPEVTIQMVADLAGGEPVRINIGNTNTPEWREGSYKELSDGTYQFSEGTSLDVIKYVLAGVSPNAAVAASDFGKAVENFSLSLSVQSGAARAGVEFLRDMVPALSDPKNIQSLIVDDQLPFVISELTAFQSKVLDGKTLGDFSLEWWQVELYQRADVFRRALSNLDIALSQPSEQTQPSEQMLTALKEKFVSRMNGATTLAASIAAGKASFADINRGVRYQQAGAIENALMEQLGYTSDTTDFNYDQVQQFFANQSYVKELGNNYQQQSIVRMLQLQYGSVVIRYNDISNNTWQQLDKTVSTQPTGNSLAALAVALPEVQDLLDQIPQLQNDIVTLIANLQAVDPENSLILDLKDRQGDLADQEAIYRDYVKSWSSLLTSVPAESQEGTEFSSGPLSPALQADLLIQTLVPLNFDSMSSIQKAPYISQAQDLLKQLDPKTDTALFNELSLYERALTSSTPVAQPAGANATAITEETLFLQNLQTAKATDEWQELMSAQPGMSPERQEILQVVQESIERMQGVLGRSTLPDEKEQAALLLTQLFDFEQAFIAESSAADLVETITTRNSDGGDFFTEADLQSYVIQITSALAALEALPAASTTAARKNLIDQLKSLLGAINATLAARIQFAIQASRTTSLTPVPQKSFSSLATPSRSSSVPASTASSSGVSSVTGTPRPGSPASSSSASGAPF